MKPYIASLINAFILISMGMWAYFSTEKPSITALIPVTAGVVLIATNSGLKRENKVIAHIVVIITLFILIALIKPLTGVIKRNDSIGLFRVLLMQASCLLAMVFFVKSFIDARKKS